jgi:hypothetical protein
VPEAIYVQNDLDPQLFGFRINEADGSLTPISGSPFPIPMNTRRLTATIDGKFVLAARFGGVPPEPVGLYAIPVGADGSLPRVPDTPSLPGVISSASVAPNLLYAVEAPAEITQHGFNAASGSFSPPANATPCMPHVFEFQCGWLSGPSPDGNTLWLRGTQCDSIQCSDSLTAVPVENGEVAFPPVDDFAIAGLFTEPVVLNSGIISVAFDGFDSNSVVTSYSPDGKLVSRCGGVDSPGCAEAWSVASDPNRKFLLIGTFDGKLSSVRLTATSFDPKQVKVSLVTNVRPDNMVVNSTGEFLYIVDNLSNSLTGYRIGTDGSLTAIAGAKVDIAGANAASSGRIDRAAVIVTLPTN